MTPPARPFLKWAGGKTQLLPAIEAALPRHLDQKRPLVYIEPFVGSGAVLFWFLQRFPQVERAVINDLNADLTQAYRTVQQTPHDLIAALEALEAHYRELPDEAARKDFYLEQRTAFNARTGAAAAQTARLLFLNRTCFNGLYRVNARNQFNVPFGRYARPRICDAPNLLAASRLLQKVEIRTGSYHALLAGAGPESFVYLDPPYRPISATASFNAYASEAFDDAAQRRLRDFCQQLTLRGSQWLLSNSDPKNEVPDDAFFDDLYGQEGITIARVPARRMINSRASGRGAIQELLIRNYAPKTP